MRHRVILRMTATIAATGLVLGLGGCADVPVAGSLAKAGQNAAAALGAATSRIKPGSTLIVTRRLYLTEDSTTTFIQGGYPIDVSRLDRFDHHCQFRLNFKGLDNLDVDSTRIEPGTFQITGRTLIEQTTQVDPIFDQSAKGEMFASGTLTQNTWETVLKIKSDEHPWIRELACFANSNHDRFLSAEEMAETLAPSVTLKLNL